MNGSNLHDYVFHIEAPLRERAAAEAAQRAQALKDSRGARQSFGSTIRNTLGEALIGIGRSLQGRQGRQGRQAPTLEDGAEPAT